jgi:hypothetical protein
MMNSNYIIEDSENLKTHGRIPPMSEEEKLRGYKAIENSIKRTKWITKKQNDNSYNLRKNENTL